MNKTPSYSIFLGLLIGAIFGLGTGLASGNAIMGLGVGALADAFIGWFIMAAVLELRKKTEIGGFDGR